MGSKRNSERNHTKIIQSGLQLETIIEEKNIMRSEYDIKSLNPRKNLYSKNINKKKIFD